MVCVTDMTHVAAQLEARGFEMGLYSALSSVQCGMAPGGLYHEDLDAAAYSAWGLSCKGGPLSTGFNLHCRLLPPPHVAVSASRSHEHSMQCARVRVHVWLWVDALYLADLKYDNCAEYALEPNARSSPMRDALNRTTGRPILFSTETFHLCVAAPSRQHSASSTLLFGIQPYSSACQGRLLH